MVGSSPALNGADRGSSPFHDRARSARNKVSSMPKLMTDEERRSLLKEHLEALRRLRSDSLPDDVITKRLNSIEMGVARLVKSAGSDSALHQFIPSNGALPDLDVWQAIGEQIQDTNPGRLRASDISDRQVMTPGRVAPLHICRPGMENHWVEYAKSVVQGLISKIEDSGGRSSEPKDASASSHDLDDAKRSEEADPTNPPKMPPRILKAGASLEWVLKEHPELAPPESDPIRYTKEMWDAINNGDCPAYPDDKHGRSTVPSWDSWSRYIRKWIKDHEPNVNEFTGRSFITASEAYDARADS